MDQIIDSFFQRYGIPQNEEVLIGRAGACHIRIDHPAVDSIHLRYNPSTMELTALSHNGATISYRVCDGEVGSANHIETISPRGRDRMTPREIMGDMFFVHLGDEDKGIVLTFQREYIHGDKEAARRLRTIRLPSGGIYQPTDAL